VHALIATDGSQVSIDAARAGLELLQPSRVTLVSVADTMIATDSGAGGIEGNLLTPEESEQARTAILDEGDHELADTARALGLDPSEVDMRVVEGSAGQMVVHTADEVDADVIVVGSHGHGFLSRVLIGSVSEYVVRHTTRPVLVLRHADAAGAPGGD
jgi:nucleotide-binding universal stress UspA family protein